MKLELDKVARLFEVQGCGEQFSTAAYGERPFPFCRVQSLLFFVMFRSFQKEFIAGSQEEE